MQWSWNFPILVNEAKRGKYSKYFYLKKVIKNIWLLLGLVVTKVISFETNYDGVFTKLNFSVKVNIFLLFRLF